MTAFLWDASHYDGLLSPGILARARSEGIVGFTHKIAEGLQDTEGRNDDTALAAARSAGIEFIGGYLIPRSNASVGAQVDRWIQLADQGEPWWRDHPGWFWQIDLERWSYDNVAASTGIAAAQQLRARTGRWTVLYASHGQYGDALTGWDGPLWNADYVSKSPTGFAQMYPGDGWTPSHGSWRGGWAPYSGREPTILQYTSSATIAGLSTCDANAYRGSVEQLRALIAGHLNLTQGGDVALKDEALPVGAPNAAQALADIWYDLVKGRSGFTNPDGTHDVHHVNMQLNGIEQALAAVALDAKAAASLPTVVTMTAEDRAAIVAELTAALTPLVPTPAQIATAVLDEQHRRDAA